VGKGPMSVVLDKEHGVAYVTDTEYIVDGKNINKTLSLIDLNTNEVKEKIDVGVGPFDMKIIDGKLFVSNSGEWTVSVLDTGTRKVIKKFKVIDTPLGVGIHSKRKKVYVAIHGKGSVSIFDAANLRELKTIKIGKSAWYIAVDEKHDRAYVSIRNENKIAIIDTEKDEVIKTIKVGKGPLGIAVDPEANRLYVVNHRDVSLWIVDTKTNKKIGEVKLSPATESTYSGSPWGIALY
jgi:YVTN family beta-propeller protein